MVRDDLRSYALRRCIRFYTAILVMAIAWSASLTSLSARADALRGGALLLLVIAAVEIASMIVMVPMASARRRLGGGPETPLWRFAQGPWPSLVAAAFFAAVAVFFAVSANVST